MALSGSSNRVQGGVVCSLCLAVILRNSLLISSMLSNSEVWYGLTKKDTDLLEQIDEMWMRNLFECSRNIAKDLLYLELGVVPISFL